MSLWNSCSPSTTTVELSTSWPYTLSMIKNNTDLANWLRNRLNKNLFIDEWQRSVLEALLKTLILERKDIHPVCKI